MNNDVTVKIWLTNILIALPIAIVLSVVVNNVFDIPGTAQGWVGMACSLATVIAVHEIRKRKREDQRRRANTTAHLLSGHERRTASAWSEIPEDPDE